MPLNPRDKKHYCVFLASPGDVDVERQQVRQFFDQFNRSHGQAQNLHFDVVDWEHNSSIGGSRAQGLIIQQTLERFQDSLVLFVGVMYQRFGSPTGKAESGTEEEFNWAIDHRRKHGYPEIKFFFRNVKYLTVSSDPAQARNTLEQWGKVLAFKERLRSLDDSVFFGEYDAPDTFRDTLDSDLDIWLTSPDRPWASPESPQAVTISTALTALSDQTSLEDARRLAQAGLIGRWYGKNDHDRSAIEQIVGMPYDRWISSIQIETLRPDRQLSQTDEKYRFPNRKRAWATLGRHLFDADLKAFEGLTKSVFTEKDPRFDMPADDRYPAQVFGKELKHSDSLRCGLAETLALLGSHREALTSCSLHEPERVATLTVRHVLASADWALWASLDGLLPLLAEASPDEFLAAIDAALESPACPFRVLFEQQRPGITGWNHMTGILWALETLAWDARYLARVVLALAKLAEIDPGGNWGNRPSNSLIEVFLPWRNHTVAPLATREAAIRALVNEHPEVGWHLLLGLLPRAHSVSSGTREPAWRDFVPPDFPESPTDQQYQSRIRTCTSLAISAALNDVSKLTGLIDHLPGLPEPVIDEIVAHLQSEAARLPEAERLPLWEELVALVAGHRRRADAECAMPPSVVDRLARSAELLRPKSILLLHRRLFDERDRELYEGEGSHSELEANLIRRRNDAVSDILGQHGLETVFSFADTVPTPGYVGASLASLKRDGMDDTIIPARLVSDKASQRQLARSYVWSRYRELGWDWLDGFDLSSWTRQEIAELFSTLPFQKDTWNRAERFLGENSPEYWTKAWVHCHSAKGHLHEAIPNLLKCRRTADAVNCLAWMVHEQEVLTPEFALKVLQESMRQGGGEGPKIDPHDVIEVVGWLQNHHDTDKDELLKLEWALIPVLDRLHGGRPLTLERKLAEDPEFYCELMRSVFRSDKEEAEDREASERERDFASNAYRLITHWKIPPGLRADSTVDESAAASWMSTMRASSEKSGHLRPALSQFGHVLVYAPADPDGLWIHRVYASFLDAQDAEPMRSGFTIELLNSRGAHWFSAGAEERKIADKYDAQANAVEVAGFVRMATALRQLAQSYRHDAERDARRDPRSE